MNAARNIFIFLTALMLWGCLPKYYQPDIPLRGEPGDRLFAKAEKKFNQAEYR